jgi:hypothetical protein
VAFFNQILKPIMPFSIIFMVKIHNFLGRVVAFFAEWWSVLTGRCRTLKIPSKINTGILLPQQLLIDHLDFGKNPRFWGY